MKTGYIPRKPIKQIIENFKREYSAVDKFVEDNFIKIGEGTNLLQTEESYISKITNSQNIEYMQDEGNGRISKGVRSLDLICKVFQGIPASSLTLFDQEIYNLDYTFSTLSTDDARLNIYQNLGITQFVPLGLLISTEIVSEFNIFVDKIVKSLKAKTFTYDLYHQEALRQCKLIVNTATNVKNKGIK